MKCTDIKSIYDSLLATEQHELKLALTVYGGSYEFGNDGPIIWARGCNDDFHHDYRIRSVELDGSNEIHINGVCLAVVDNSFVERVVDYDCGTLQAITMAIPPSDNISDVTTYFGED